MEESIVDRLMEDLDKVKREKATTRGPSSASNSNPYEYIQDYAMRSREQQPTESMWSIEAIKNFGYQQRAAQGGLITKTRPHAQSLAQFATGGPVTKTGPIFAHKGEFVLPQEFCLGGPVSGANSDVATGIMNQPTQQAPSFDTSALEKIILKIEDKVFTVEDKVFTVEDRVFTVEDKIFTVDIPTDKLNITVDVTAAASELSSEISKALSKGVSVNVSGEGAGVGGEKFDALTNLVGKVRDEIITINGQVESKISIIDSMMNKQTSDIDRRVVGLVSSLTDGLKTELNTQRQQLADVGAQVRRDSSRYSQEISDILSKISRIKP